MVQNALNKRSCDKSKLAYIFFPIFKKQNLLLSQVNSKEHYLVRILNICPELKLQPVFKKKFEFQSQNLGIKLWNLLFSKFFKNLEELPLIFLNFIVGLFFPLFFSHGFKRVFYSIIETYIDPVWLIRYLEWRHRRTVAIILIIHSLKL